MESRNRGVPMDPVTERDHVTRVDFFPRDFFWNFRRLFGINEFLQVGREMEVLLAKVESFVNRV